MSSQKTTVEPIGSDQFLDFCYNFPLDMEERFINAFGKRLGMHFYTKYRGYRKEYDAFYAMIRTYCAMTDDNRRIFDQIIKDYYQEVEQNNPQ